MDGQIEMISFLNEKAFWLGMDFWPFLLKMFKQSMGGVNASGIGVWWDWSWESGSKSPLRQRFAESPRQTQIWPSSTNLLKNRCPNSTEVSQSFQKQNSQI